MSLPLNLGTMLYAEYVKMIDIVDTFWELLDDGKTEKLCHLNISNLLQAFTKS